MAKRAGIGRRDDIRPASPGNPTDPSPRGKIMTDRISVVVPCRNAAQWLGEALASAIDQHRPADEIILVDDGSTDASVAVARSFGDRVRVVQSEAGNAAAARNIGVKLATGRWIAFLDADDRWYPHHLEQSVKLLSAGNDVGVQTWYDYFSNATPGVVEQRSCHIDIDAPTHGLAAETYFRHYVETQWINMHACVVDRQRLVDVGMFDETQTRRHDIEMWMRLTEGRTWAFHPVASSAYRYDTPGSITRATVDAAYFLVVAVDKNFDRLPRELASTLRGVALDKAVWAAAKNGDDGQRERIAAMRRLPRAGTPTPVKAA